jgi:hypothetical protein
MASISTDFTQVVKLQARLRVASASTDWDKHLASAGDRIGRAGVPLYQSVTPVVTGQLRDSTTYLVAKDGKDTVVRFSQPAMNARGDQYVQWVLPPGHGSYPGNPYPQSVADQVQRGVHDELHTAIDEALAVMATRLRGIL